jgi:hypothetical protein
MARTSEPDSATSQFFINVKDNHSLDFGVGPGAGYAVFGRVTEGMDVVDRIVAVPTTTRPPHSNVPQTAVVIKKVRIVSGAPAVTPAAKPPAKPAAPGAKPAGPKAAPKPASPKP